MDSTTTKPVCAVEALALLNCATESSYDRDKCLALLDALRACIAQKKVKNFLLAETSSTGTTETPTSK
ncbi:hypothetical protein ABZP36_014669 [Zizania latifolia]